MAKIHIAKDGERLDQIVFNYYGSTLPVEMVMSDNPQLLHKITLDAGDKVLLNEYTINTVKDLPTGEGVALW